MSRSNHRLARHSFGRMRGSFGPQVVYVYQEPCYCDGVPCLCPPVVNDTGALERRNPLPPGIYSVDLRNDQVSTFRTWQEGRSAVKVLKTNDNGEFSWILFSVSAPTVWAQGIGFPDTAKATDERPQAFEPTKDPLDRLADSLSLSPPLVLIGGAIAAGLTLYAFRKELFEDAKRTVRKYRASRSG